MTKQNTLHFDKNIGESVTPMRDLRAQGPDSARIDDARVKLLNTTAATFLHLYPIFSVLPNLNFLPSETQKFELDKFLPHPLSQPKMNYKSPKDPQSILILTIKLLYTYFWKTLPIGDLIWLAPIWLTFSKSPQVAQPTSNHLKRHEVDSHAELANRETQTKVRREWDENFVDAGHICI